MNFPHRHVLGIKQFNAEELTFILDTAESFKEINTRNIKKVPTLRGKQLSISFLKRAREHGPLLRLQVSDFRLTQSISVVLPPQLLRGRRLKIRPAILNRCTLTS
jgi:hypothetical protein